MSFSLIVAVMYLSLAVNAAFRVPAVPLWVHSPYLNWVVPADNATDAWVTHVRDDKVVGITAALRVDGRAFSLLGPLHRACPAGSALALPPLPQVGAPIVKATREPYLLIIATHW